MARPYIRLTGRLWIMFVMILASGLSAAPHQGELLTKEGKVEATGRITNWIPAEVGLKLSVFDRLRTRELSRATVRLAELGRLRIDELTTLEILPPTQSAGKGIIDLKAGAVYIFTRDKPREFLLQTPDAIGASRGTEFVVEVDPAGRTVVTVFDGEVDLYNAQGSVTLFSGDQGTVLRGQEPVRTPAIQAVSVVQWWLYYPGVLDLDEVPLTPAEQAALAASLNAYRTGDLLQAIANYPAGRVPASDAERIYHAGLLLAVGQVDQADTELNAIEGELALVAALRMVILAVTGRGQTVRAPISTASEWLAQSYLHQRTNLQAALASARAAVENSPGFGFAWARVAELEFSFGRINATDRALRRALEISPRNGQAIALRGFVLAAQNRISEAQRVFDEALEIDGALGNAWLGRGLCRMRQGDTEGGRADMQTAAGLEPNRSLLRSYLGKAFDEVQDEVHAHKELDLAKRLDKNDPTPWLYSALLHYEEHRINEAVRSLEKSVELNDNRQVYRSELLLDQDRSVRSASLATIYQRAGLPDVSVREAARAVSDDYGNYSAHLFLANSFDALRDPTRFNLRYETAWFNELLLANLLAPVGAGTFSQSISQQEYSRLFERNRLGLVTTTEVRSDHQYREIASQFGTIGNTSYSLDLDYQRNEGVRPNNELTRIEWYTQIKQQLTPQDSIFLLAKYQDYHSGDNFQHYDPERTARTNFSFDEFQQPILVGGYHREWAPGVHTLFLGGRLVNEQEMRDRAVLLPLPSTNAALDLIMDFAPFDVQFENDFEIYTGELNQILQTEHLTTIVGGRLQGGEFERHNRLTSSQGITNYQRVNSVVEDHFDRLSFYAYQTVKFARLWITAGVSYDRLEFPENVLQVPVQEGTDMRDAINPKAAIVWSPAPMVVVRGMYTKSLGGVSFDESFRLEPVQLAGFSQAFRTVIPESIVGSVPAPEFETFGAGIDLKFATATYFGIQAELIRSSVDRVVGTFFFDNRIAYPVPTGQNLDYEERVLSATVNQLIGQAWSIGGQYRFAWAELESRFPEFSPALNPGLDSVQRGELHQLGGYLLFNHDSGFFARADTQWYWQHNRGYNPDRPGDSFVHVNSFIGYRFPRLRGEISIGVLNITDEDYRLNPLNAYAELPRERVFAARLRVNF